VDGEKPGKGDGNSKKKSSLTDMQELEKRFTKLSGNFARLIGIIVLLLVSLEFLCFVALRLFGLITSDKTQHPMNADIYKNHTWAKDYFAEFDEVNRGEYYAYVGHRRVPNYRGRYINLDSQSVRKTVNPCLHLSARPIKIFTFGGSTLWGTGARDGGTIPSHLSKHLCQKGLHVQVINFGESGYTSFQEVIRLQLELKKANIPKVVVFYGGFNDVISSFQNATAGLPQNVEHRKRDFNSRSRLNIAGLFPNCARIWNKMVRRNNAKQSVSLSTKLNAQTALNYLTNLKIVQALEEAFGFRAFFYWQPSIYTKQPLSNEEKSRMRDVTFLSRSYDAVLNLLKNSRVIDLTNIFDHEKASIFIDSIHTSEEGNSIIAERISRDLSRYLQRAK